MKQYLEYTRAPWYSFLFVLPLLALYQVAALLANLGQRQQVINGADALLQSLLGVVGLHGWLATGLVLTVIGGIVAYRTDPGHRKGPVRWTLFVPMLAESTVYALLFGSVVGYLTYALLPGGMFLQIGPGGLSPAQKLATGLGAGLYEELVFRLLLTGGLIGLLRRTKWKPAAITLVAVLVSSFIFSAFHYVGPLSDPFSVASFTFRFLGGIVLAALFAARGFAVAAWTHSLYDVFLLLFFRG